MKHIVVDFEMNPISREYKEQKAVCRNEIIEIGAVLLDENFKENGSFQMYVKPDFSKKLRQDIVQLTGITDAMVVKAPSFIEAIQEFFKWCLQCEDEIEMIQWSDTDYIQISKEMLLKQYTLSEKEERLMQGWHDLQKECGDTIGMERQTSLKNAVMLSGEDFEGRQHDALYDARNTAKLLKSIRVPEERMKSFGKVINVLKDRKPLVSSLGDLFDFSKVCVTA